MSRKSKTPEPVKTPISRADIEAKFAELWNQMLDLVTSDGTELADDELVESDVILPPRDSTFEDAKMEWSGEGLIPD